MPRRAIETLNPRAPKASKLDRAYPWIRAREKSCSFLWRTKTLKTFAFPHFRTRTWKIDRTSLVFEGYRTLAKAKRVRCGFTRDPIIIFDFSVAGNKITKNCHSPTFSFIQAKSAFRLGIFAAGRRQSAEYRWSGQDGRSRSTRARATRLDSREQTMPSLGAISSRGGCFHLRKYWYRRVRARVPTPR